jgi:ammonium transporter, Amt family
MLFLTGWLIFVYFPFVHMVWGGGMLQKWGVHGDLLDADAR